MIQILQFVKLDGWMLQTPQRGEEQFIFLHAAFQLNPAVTEDQADRWKVPGNVVQRGEIIDHRHQRIPLDSPQLLDVEMGGDLSAHRQ